MEIYLVGGAIRDKLLGLRVNERDWVVVGATPEEMLSQGYKKVGRDFPVFLHPKTHEEYALARTEKKTGNGYTGFVCHASPDVTLEEDLQRRDLTINAIAQTLDGNLIDPYGGIKDLKAKILRHVSAAFLEDPVRILRVARFAAHLEKFKVHPSTNHLMHQMLLNSEVDFLVPERVWQEFDRALAEKNPQRFFEVLSDCKILSKLFPEISQHFTRTKTLLKKAINLNASSTQRFAVLFAYSEPEEIKEFCKRYRVPRAYQDCATVFAKHKKTFILAKKLSALSLLKLFEQTDAFRRPDRFFGFLQVNEICGNKSSLEKSKYLQKAYKQLLKLDVQKIIKDIEKSKIATTIKNARLQKLEDYLA